MYDHEQPNTTTGLEMHWNGTSWQQVTALPAFIFTGVKSFSASDATAVGDDRTAMHTYRPAAFGWNGTSWALTAILPTPWGARVQRRGQFAERALGHRHVGHRELLHHPEGE